MEKHLVLSACSPKSFEFYNFITSQRLESAEHITFMPHCRKNFQLHQLQKIIVIIEEVKFLSRVNRRVKYLKLL